MKLIITKDYEEMSKKAYTEFSSIINKIEEPKIGFATGSTPIGFYKEIVNSYQKNGVSYENLKAYNLDEYIGLNQDNQHRYNYFLNHHIFNKINVKKENIDIILDNNNPILMECDRYSDILSKNPLDVQILGLGANGHVGFNEPGTKFNSKTRVVELNEVTIKDNSRLFSNIDEVPKHAITVGITDILNAKNIILLASGINKSEAVKKMIAGEISELCPASYLQNHNNVTVIIDQEAASKL
ncbi:glucosamine-6-phosphate deaminase [Candidatus Izimaplasma bacterium ZiA1]|uniref:glucosamine-6-phosphate deaminase n=1 Tax=Candidatus Izimoplasma sp. ZiA1 TaxID=2024899 RepID=UPI000BAA6D6A|nr:glucosamine-6-phosphate deaminase [Candidatus Izimaplasma bacterium ZiA1]